MATATAKPPARNKRPARQRVKKWEWRNGCRLGGDVNAIGRMIDQLTVNGVPCSAERFVEEARNPRSPAHHLFEWDVQKAAQAHWEERARLIIRSCRVIYEDGPAEVSHIGYFKVCTPQGDGYLPEAQVMTQADLRQQVLQDALRQLAGLQERIRDIRELQEVYDAIGRALAQHRR